MIRQGYVWRRYMELLITLGQVVLSGEIDKMPGQNEGPVASIYILLLTCLTYLVIRQSVW